jgi:3-oxoacyl-[acyl-carrier protein] reductase
VSERDLDGRVALVTGAARNIGRQIALTLGARGAAVLVHVGTDEAAGRAVAEEISSKGGRAISARADLARPQEIYGMVERAARELGACDILVNSAAIRPHRRFVELTEEIWADTLAVNLTGPFVCMKAVVPGMIAAGQGAIVNIGGIAAWDGRPAESAHLAATKAGLHGLTKALAVELGEHGIRVNSVVLSTIDTVRAVPLDDQPVGSDAPRLTDSIGRQLPLRRLGRVDEVANVVAFLASDASSYITGQAIHVNGGALLA